MNKARGYYFTPESIREYIEMSEGSDGREIIKKLQDYLPEGSSVLELGTGPGRDLGILMKTYIATGSDISPIFIDYCRQKLPDSDLLLLDAVNIDEERSFDAIYSNKVLQHLSDKELKQSVLRQSELLNANGIVCHTFWEGEGEEFIEDLRFNYQKLDDLQSLFSQNFNILENYIYKEMRDNDSVLLIARKKKK